MLRNLQDLHDFRINATDGNIGHIKDFYFGDDRWVVRYFVVNTGTWLSGKMVLISPISIQHPDWSQGTLAASISRAQIEASPDIDTDKPVSRQNEEQAMAHYGYPLYWEGSGMWGGGMDPYALAPGLARNRMDRVDREHELEAYLRDERARHRNDDPHLRSCAKVVGYHIDALDGTIGHVAGYLVDDETWAIRYLIVDTSNWWIGHKVLVAPTWIKGVHWADRTVTVDLSRELVRNSPPYDSSSDWGRDQEARLYRHYDRSGYWTVIRPRESTL